MNDTVSNIGNLSGNFSVNDTIYPQLFFVYPLNFSYNVNVSVINYTYVEVAPGHCWYSTNNGVSNSSIVDLGTNFTNVVSDEHSNTWRLYCNDSAGNLNSTDITFIKDTIYPDLNLTYPLNASYDTNLSIINYTYNDTYPGNCWYTNSSGIWNSSFVNATINFTNVLTREGGNNYTIYCNDSANNINTSSVSFFKDSLPPILNIAYPLNTTYNEYKTDLKYTYYEASPGHCWYSNDSGVWNSSVVAMGVNFTTTSVEGTNRYDLWCNDTGDHLGGDNESFTIDFYMVDNCTTISSPGEYYMVSNISDTTTCITITSSNVTFDCRNKIKNCKSDHIFLSTETIILMVMILEPLIMESLLMV